MTNQIAISLGILLVLAIGADVMLNDTAGIVFVARKLADLIEYLAFWR